jgi:hypothetical protein
MIQSVHDVGSGVHVLSRGGPAATPYQRLLDSAQLSRSESTAVNARKRGFDDGVQPVNKEPGRTSPASSRWESRVSAPSFTTLI